MRLDTATLAMTALALIVPSVTAVPWKGSDPSKVPRDQDHYIPRGRLNNNNRHNLRDGNRGDAAARQLLERATPEHQRVAKPPTGVGKNGRIDHDFTFDRKAKANMAVDSDPTYEISYLSKNEDEAGGRGYEEEHPDGALRKRNPHEASCYDVPTFALNGILGMFPPDERCTHVKSGQRSFAITCYHSSEGAGKKDKRSADEMHEERRLQFLSICDSNTRPEADIN